MSAQADRALERMLNDDTRAQRELVRRLVDSDPATRLGFISALSKGDQSGLLKCWYAWARPEQIAPDGDWRTWLILAGRGWGKALCLETPIPTPGGWKHIGDIQPGDTVFDEAGVQCEVTATFDPPVESAFRLTFSDGTHLDACGEHQWLTLNALERKRLNRRGVAIDPAFWAARRTTVTTTEIARTFRRGSRGDLNHAIPTCGALQTDSRTLPIPPYVLGAWLGDGDSAGAVMTSADDEMVAAIEARGIRCGEKRLDPRSSAFRFSIGAQPPARGPDGKMTGNGSVHTRLRMLGLIGNKHVPPVYMRASEGQRRELLAGLMDTDGHADASKVEFCSMRRELAADVVELARSLGEKPRLYVDRARLNGEDMGPRFRVVWRPLVNPFSMERKRNAVRALGAQANRNRQRMIVDVQPIAPKPMRCLTVDSPNAMFLAGEGMIPTHNTRTGAEFVRDEVFSGRARVVALVAQDAGDVRDVMIEGPAGLIAISAPHQRPIWTSSKRRLTWPNGAYAVTFSAEDPEALRGPQHDLCWADEMCAWSYAEDTWSNLDFGLRLPGPDGSRPRVVVTTTPRPTKTLRKILARPDTILTRGSSLDNRANLAPEFFTSLLAEYEGTRLGRQELHAEVLDDTEGALWTRLMIDAAHEVGRSVAHRVRSRVVVAIDPAASDTESGAETGIVVAASLGEGLFLVLEDLSLKGSPKDWATVAVDAFDRWQADRIVAEGNNGGEMVRGTIHSVRENVPVKIVHASRGKIARGEPVASLYEQRRVGHLRSFPKLEDQQCTFTGARGERSPDRYDAAVWALTELMSKPGIADIDIDVSIGHAANPWSA